jgi:hypothetical protein
MKRAMRSSGSKCFSLQTPRSCGEIRPSGVTAAASVKMSAAPPTAREEMGEVPIVGETVLAGILAHRRHADTVGEGDVAQFELAEQMGHRHALSQVMDRRRRFGAGWRADGFRILVAPAPYAVGDFNLQTRSP